MRSSIAFVVVCSLLRLRAGTADRRDFIKVFFVCSALDIFANMGFALLTDRFECIGNDLWTRSVIAGAGIAYGFEATWDGGGIEVIEKMLL